VLGGDERGEEHGVFESVVAASATRGSPLPPPVSSSPCRPMLG
jgi:hypothetical protein